MENTALFGRLPAIKITRSHIWRHHIQPLMYLRHCLSLITVLSAEMDKLTSSLSNWSRAVHSLSHSAASKETQANQKSALVWPPLVILRCLWNIILTSSQDPVNKKCLAVEPMSGISLKAKRGSTGCVEVSKKVMHILSTNKKINKSMMSILKALMNEVHLRWTSCW